MCALTLRHASTEELLGAEHAIQNPEYIGLFEFLNALPAASGDTSKVASQMRGLAVLLLLLILPFINAVMDWLSVAFSRAQFAKLSRDLGAASTTPSTQSQWPQLSKGLWDLIVDALVALMFKLAVLGLLTFWAFSIDGRGVSFTWQTMSNYWQMVWPLGKVPFSSEALFHGNNLLITLMIATTLVPTVLHGAWVLLVIAVKGMAAISRSVFFAALWQPKLGAAVLSVLCVCGLVSGVYVANQAIQGQSLAKNTAPG